jgi:hypothetical protein
MEQFILYSTSGCHLCEQARRLIYAALGTLVAEVDITSDERLLDLYGTRIPVLRRVDKGIEISWPFGPEEVKALLS